MKTDQKMVVQLGNATVKIHHKTMMGSLNDILTIGNSYRLAKGLRELRMDEYLNKESTWELIQSAEYRVNKDFYNDGNPVIIKLCDFKKKNGQLEYSKLMKKFSVIKSKRGKGGGTWGHLYIMLDLATQLDSDFKVLVFETFIKGKNNRGVYIQIAKQFRVKWGGME